MRSSYGFQRTCASAPRERLCRYSVVGPSGPTPQRSRLRSVSAPRIRRRGGAALSRIHISPDGHELRRPRRRAAGRPVRARAVRIARRRQVDAGGSPRRGVRRPGGADGRVPPPERRAVDDGPAGSQGRAGHLRRRGVRRPAGVGCTPRPGTVLAPAFDHGRPDPCRTRSRSRPRPGWWSPRATTCCSTSRAGRPSASSSTRSGTWSSMRRRASSGWSGVTSRSVAIDRRRPRLGGPGRPGQRRPRRGRGRPEPTRCST